MRTSVLPILLLLACCGEADFDVTSPDPESPEASQFALTMSSADAAELLAFVNDPSTTSNLLDDQVALDARAAAAIITHRDGADGIAGTSDDDLYGTVAELDHVAFVGDTALKRLLAWALTHPVAKAETVEGVAFTAEQVSLVLWGVNQATNDELNDELQLENRAVNALLAGKPFVSVAGIGAAPYVGPAALTKLRANAPVWAAKRAGTVTLAGTFDSVTFDEATAKAALKLANTATVQELTAGGLPVAGAAPITSNRPFATLEQVSKVHGVGVATMRALHALAKTTVPVTPSVPDGEACDARRVCLSGLVCAGLTHMEHGFCRPSWMANTFRSGTPLAIPDGAPVSIGITVRGLASVPEDVIVHLELDHPRKSDLQIVLTQPSSAESVVWPVGSNGDARVVMGAGVERDSGVNGEWFLTIVDTVSGQTGTLNGWSLELTSRWD
ncbi:MAG: proprotein convertase P-domain-containing protein [Myxococcaceae bacterium]|nr:proprotein convertase P-domain-containing protein [Myxococcaceae bacterium]